MCKRFEQTCHQRGYTMENKPRKICSILSAIREVQIKTTVRYYHMPTRIINKKMENTTSVGEEAEHWNSHPLLVEI